MLLTRIMELGRTTLYDQPHNYHTHISSSHTSLQSFSSQSSTSSSSSSSSFNARVCLPQPQAAVKELPLDQRRNPRRCPANTSQKPPTLVRQDERKASFVDGLVDSATQMVEVIWPLSVAPCRPQTGGVLSLRRYIEETLRRSRTSYSTLQVALYYLVLIMPFVPKSDFTMQQSVDSASVRALQCGRRMFLAALILASKYLQDRNYSAKAWSKMSGLKAVEINLNERAFLEAVNWKLHIPDHIFKRWTDVVLRYTPSQFPPPSSQSFSIPEQKTCWKSVIPLLTPELEQVSVTLTQPSAYAQPISPVSEYSVLPSFLEPQPDVVPPTPAIPGRIDFLPTPRMTPPLVNTPAASVAGLGSDGLSRGRGRGSRRSSPAPSETSTVLSPESMVSDISSRLSRSSSVSSVSTGLSGHSYQGRLVVVASPSSMHEEQTLAEYDAQPKMASRLGKRGRSGDSDSEEEESKLQARVRVLLEKEETREGTVRVNEQVLKPYVPYKIMIEEDRKRRRMSYGEKSFGSEAITAY